MRLLGVLSFKYAIYYYARRSIRKKYAAVSAYINLKLSLEIKNENCQVRKYKAKRQA